MFCIEFGIVLGGPSSEGFLAAFVGIEELSDGGVVKMRANLATRLFERSPLEKEVDGGGYRRSVDASVAVD
jgi:hypothetical protein